MNRIFDRIVEPLMLWFVLAIAIACAVSMAGQVAYAAPPTAAAKAAASDATVQVRKDSQPELPDSLDKGNGSAGEQPAAVNDESPSEPQEAVSAPVSPRPVVYLYTVPYCRDCEFAKKSIARGELPDLDVRERQPPEWVTVCPTWHWEDRPGQWKQVTGWGGPEWLLDKITMPPTMTAAQGAPKSAADQLWKFLPPGTRITIEPPRPVKATLEDGTIVSYPKISGVLGQQNGNPGIKLDPPLPQVSARKFFLRFGATVSGAEYEAATPAGAGVMTIETSRGKFRMKLEEVP